MAYRVDLTPRAERDLAILYSNINAENSPAAERWFNRLETFIYQLEAAPLIGFVTHERPNVRQLIYGNKPHFYRILYKVNEARKVVLILHIRHGRQSSFSSEIA